MNALAACLAGLTTAYSAHCAPFADPTRPPTQVDPATVGQGAPSGPRLESVLIAPDRRIAVINGQQYKEGASFGGGRVLRISETEVVIRQGGQDQVLKLFPQGVKRAASAGGKK